MVTAIFGVGPAPPCSGRRLLMQRRSAACRRLEIRRVSKGSRGLLVVKASAESDSAIPAPQLKRPKPPVRTSIETSTAVTPEVLQPIPSDLSNSKGALGNIEDELSGFNLEGLQGLDGLNMTDMLKSLKGLGALESMPRELSSDEGAFGNNEEDEMSGFSLEGLQDLDGLGLTDMLDSLAGLDPNEGAQVLEVIDGLLKLSDEELVKVWGQTMGEYGDQEPEEMEADISGMLQQLSAVQQADGEDASPQALQRTLNSLLDRLSSVNDMIGQTEAEDVDVSVGRSSDAREGGVSASSSELGQEIELGEEIEAAEEGDVDGLTAWRSASDMMLATLLVSSYSCYLGRPLLSSSGSEVAVASSGPESSSAELDDSLRLQEAPFALVYVDCSEPGQQVVEYCNTTALSAWASDDSDLIGKPALSILEAVTDSEGWAQWSSQVMDKEPHHLTLPHASIVRDRGSKVQAKEVILFRVNSIGGEPLGIGMKIEQWDS